MDGQLGVIFSIDFAVDKLRSVDPNTSVTIAVNSAVGQCSSVGSNVFQVTIADPAVEYANCDDADVKTVGAGLPAVTQC